MRVVVWAALMLCLASPLLAQTQSDPKSSSGAPSTSTTAGGGGVPGATLSLTGKITTGDQAPSFSLPAASGHERTLKSLRGDWVVIVFAPDKSEFIAFKGMTEKFAALPAVLVGITRESPQTLKGLASRNSLTFDLLGDVTGQVSASYGLYDGFASRCKPGFLVVDRTGIVRLAVVGQSLPPDQVLALTRFTIQGL